MESLRLNNRENILNNYGPSPSLPFDVEGTLVSKNGKNIKLEKTIDNKSVEIFLRLKEEIPDNIGETVNVDKENIVTSTIKEKEKVEEVNEGEEIQDKDGQEGLKAQDIIRDLGLEFTDENIKMIEFLLKSGLPISKTSVSSYIKSRDYLNKIIEGLNPDTAARLMDRGIDLEEGNLQKIAETLEEISGDRPFSLKRFLRLERDLTYQEAEEISKEIYGQKMGRDIYDAIISLHREKQVISRENIEKSLDILAKVHDLKDIEDQDLVKLIIEEEEFNINNLYKLKNAYKDGDLEENLEAKKFESFNTLKDVDIQSLRQILKDLDLDTSRENINILREFIVNDLDMDREKYEEIKGMKETLKEFIDLIDEGTIARLARDGVDIGEENIRDLLREIKKEKPEDLSHLDQKQVEDIKKDLINLGRISEKDLLILIKNGQDLTINNIREIIGQTSQETGLDLASKVVSKAIHISNIFTSLGENLKPGLVGLSLERQTSLSLENLYLANEEIKAGQATPRPVENIEESKIYEEYIRAKNSLTTNIIKDSIKENILIERMPLNDLNNYIKNKTNKYKENERLAEEMKIIKEGGDKALPFILKNQIPMTIKNIREINSLLKDLADPNENNDELMSLFNGESRDFHREDARRDQGEIILEKINSKDYSFKLPIELGQGQKEVNIIVPNLAEGIDKNNMSFYLSLETENLGPIKLGLEVKNKAIEINTQEARALDKYLDILEDRFSKLGYRLEKKVEA